MNKGSILFTLEVFNSSGRILDGEQVVSLINLL